MDSPLGIQTKNPAFDYMLEREGQDCGRRMVCYDSEERMAGNDAADCSPGA